jgi:hypothetical protein
MSRDTWILDNWGEITARLEEADRIAESNEEQACAVIEVILEDASRHPSDFEPAKTRLEESRKKLRKLQSIIRRKEADREREYLAALERKRARDEADWKRQQEESRRLAATRRAEDEKREAAEASKVLSYPLAVGERGRLERPVRIIQVLRHNQALAEIMWNSSSSTTVLLYDIPTTNWVDGDEYTLAGRWCVGPPSQYITVLGAKRTVTSFFLMSSQ